MVYLIDPLTVASKKCPTNVIVCKTVIVPMYGVPVPTE